MSTWEAQNSTWRTARILWLECIHMTWHERFEETGLKKPQKDLACSKELLSWKDAFLVGANMVSSASGAQNLLSSAGICSSLRAENHFVTLVRKHFFWGENLVANSESSQIESHFQENLNLTRPKVPQARAGKSLKLACAHSSRWQKPPAFDESGHHPNQESERVACETETPGRALAPCVCVRTMARTLETLDWLEEKLGNSTQRTANIEKAVLVENPTFYADMK